MMRSSSTYQSQYSQYFPVQWPHMMPPNQSTGQPVNLGTAQHQAYSLPPNMHPQPQQMSATMMSTGIRNPPSLMVYPLTEQTQPQTQTPHQQADQYKPQKRTSKAVKIVDPTTKTEVNVHESGQATMATKQVTGEYAQEFKDKVASMAAGAPATNREVPMVSGAAMGGVESGVFIPGIPRPNAIITNPGTGKPKQEGQAYPLTGAVDEVDSQPAVDVEKEAAPLSEAVETNYPIVPETTELKEMEKKEEVRSGDVERGEKDDLNAELPSSSITTLASADIISSRSNQLENSTGTIRPDIGVAQGATISPTDMGSHVTSTSPLSTDVPAVDAECLTEVKAVSGEHERESVSLKPRSTSPLASNLKSDTPRESISPASDVASEPAPPPDATPLDPPASELSPDPSPPTKIMSPTPHTSVTPPLPVPATNKVVKEVEGQMVGTVSSTSEETSNKSSELGSASAQGEHIKTKISHKADLSEHKELTGSVEDLNRININGNTVTDASLPETKGGVMKEVVVISECAQSASIKIPQEEEEKEDEIIPNNGKSCLDRLCNG